MNIGRYGISFRIHFLYISCNEKKNLNRANYRKAL